MKLSGMVGNEANESLIKEIMAMPDREATIAMGLLTNSIIGVITDVASRRPIVGLKTADHMDAVTDKIFDGFMLTDEDKTLAMKELFHKFAATIREFSKSDGGFQA